MWDETESNEFLYATSSRKLAEEMGIASALTQLNHNIDLFEVNNGEIHIVSQPELTIKDILDIGSIYVHVIPNNYKWTLINNKINATINEYRTNMTERNIQDIITVNIRDLIGRYRFKFN